MKTGIMTYHFVNNYGGVLQAYALSKVVSELTGENASIIDFRHWFIRFTDSVRMFPITKNSGEILSGMSTMKERFDRKKKFEKFRKEYLNCTNTISTEKKLQNYPFDFDKYICGSDQIWNPIITLGSFSPYYLSFVKDKNRKISYAASFGGTDINKKYYKKVNEYLNEFKAISVREDSGRELVSEINGRNSEILIDPTFLLKKDDWTKIASKPIETEPYILIYMMQKNDKVYSCAKKIKELLNIKIIDISRYGYKPDFVDEVCIDVGPQEFLSLFNNATYVCTNSFHGLAFSLIFEKDFYIVPSTRFNTRIENLLKVFEIELHDQVNEKTIINKCIDREKIRSIMQKEREKSIEFLRSNLQA